MQSSNPFLKDEAFGAPPLGLGAYPKDMMTLEGTLNKGLILFAILVTSAVGGFAASAAGLMLPAIIGGAILGFVLALVVSFKPTTAPVVAPLYAIAEGIAVGAISTFYGGKYPGIVPNAVLITLSILGAMFALYRARIIRATPRFVQVVTFATLGIALTYLVNIGMRAFGLGGVPFIHDASPIGVLISVGICVVASLNFIIDFDTIERGVNNGSPKWMEWYGAFGVLVTLVWLYLEVLRLLSKLRR